MDSLINDLVTLVPQRIDGELQGPFAWWGRSRNPVGPYDTKPQLPIRSRLELNRAPGDRNALTCGLMNRAGQSQMGKRLTV